MPAPRGAIVEVTLTNGQQVSHYTKFPPGTKENPLSTEEINAKARELMVPVLGTKKAQQLIAAINDLENLSDVRELRAMISSP
ncbi:MAG: hypothetical protein ABSD03_01520 [Vulcanimicrobiaceae bacterium]|jgi:2-methylcitrate dehydratase PrpD